MSEMVESPAGPPLVRFGLRQSRGVLLGLSGIRVTALGTAISVLVAGLATTGAAGMAVTAIVWLPLAAATFLPWKGRPTIDWAPIAGHWALRRAVGQTRYRARILTPRPAGTMALPGDAAALRFYTDPDSGACMIHDPHRHTLAAVLRVTHPAYLLLSADQQHNRVAAWGRVLAGLAQAGNCAAIQVLESTIPDSGQRIADWYDTNRAADGGWAADQYRHLLDQSTTGATRHRTTITVALDLRRASRAIRANGRGIPGAARVLAGDMTVVESSLRAAELHLDVWLDEDDLATMVRQAYDPNLSGDTTRRQRDGRSLSHAGPTAIDEHWDCLRHDTGWSTVLWIAEWPRIEVPSHFLHALIFAPAIRKSLSLTARPHNTAEALRQIRRQKTEMLTDSTQKARIGQIADLADAQEMADVAAREQSLIAGHADMAFSGLVTVTASTRAELTAAVAQIERAASGAVCETQVLYGQQAQAFIIAALPLARSAL